MVERERGRLGYGDFSGSEVGWMDGNERRQDDGDDGKG